MSTPNNKHRPNGITNVLGDVIDDTKGLVDDALDRAADLERDVRRGARRVVGSPDEIDHLKAALDDLTAKVNRLADLRARTNNSTR